MIEFSYKNLIVWQKAIKLVVLVYKLTSDFPQTEIYGLTSQMRRCAASTPANIAEGKRRGSDRQYKYFLRVSFGSGAELETFIVLARELKYGKSENYRDLENLLDEVMKMLNSLILR